MRRPQLLTTVPLPDLSTQHQVQPRTSEACFCVRVSESLQTLHGSHRATILWKLSWTYILRSLCVYQVSTPRRTEGRSTSGNRSGACRPACPRVRENHWAVPK